MKKIEENILKYLYINPNKTLDDIVDYTKSSSRICEYIIASLETKKYLIEEDNSYNLTLIGKRECSKKIKKDKDLKDKQLLFAEYKNYNMENFKNYLNHQNDLISNLSYLMTYEEFVILNNYIVLEQIDIDIKYEQYIGIYNYDLIYDYLEFRNYCYSNDLDIYNEQYVKSK